MLQNAKRTYALREWTVERRPAGWYFWHTYGEKEPRGPYSTMASVSLMIARELKREIKKRDEPYSLDDGHA